MKEFLSLIPPVPRSPFLVPSFDVTHTCLPGPTFYNWDGVMRLLVISDTHGHLDSSRKVIEERGPWDHVIHLGDSALDALLDDD